MLPAGDAVQIVVLGNEIMLDAHAFWGIPLALLGAAFLSFGAQYQSRGLNKVERITGSSASQGISAKHTLNLLKRPSWLVGTILLGLATVLQIGSLSFSPLILVQPIGVVALVITAFLNMHYSKVRLGAKAFTAVAMCVVGVGIFVTVAAFNAVDAKVSDTKLRIILIIFAIVFVLALVLFALMRHRAIALAYIIGAGVLYGFVATLAKTVISRLQQQEFDAYLWLSLAALILGAVLGMFFVQNAYSSGPPDLVVAGLTVVDPLIAVLIGIVVLGEAEHASAAAVIIFALSGLVAILGVFGLARYHPQAGMKQMMQTSTGNIKIPEGTLEEPPASDEAGHRGQRP